MLWSLLPCVGCSRGRGSFSQLVARKECTLLIIQSLTLISIYRSIYLIVVYLGQITLRCWRNDHLGHLSCVRVQGPLEERVLPSSLLLEYLRFGWNITRLKASFHLSSFAQPKSSVFDLLIFHIRLCCECLDLTARQSGRDASFVKLFEVLLESAMDSTLIIERMDQAPGTVLRVFQDC